MRPIVAVVLSCSLLALASCSTPALCDQACSIWLECGDWNSEECHDDCQSDGDWSQAYVDCLEGQRILCTEVALHLCL